MTKYLLLAILPFLSACATWQGKTESELVRKYGIPNNQAKIEDGKFIEYTNCGGFFNPFKAIAHGGSVCKRRTFKIVNHIVTEDLGTIYR